MLIRLIYYSTMADATSPLDVDEIVRSAQERNLEHAVTGALFSVAGHFVQILEGAREDVSLVFNLISTDFRHHDVSLVRVDEIETRTYGRWSMINFTEEMEADAQKRGLDLAAFHPRELSSQQLLDMLDRCQKAYHAAKRD